ncbi:hypothetical protein D1AOALGA4SA_1527 [Olavius algarvensis Delta 1 endosymbiont]|nr:hypothetical protein D1AOALGA4SA_1527 [Olavius algarvensis Delta 1 endosymbiont]
MKSIFIAENICDLSLMISGRIRSAWFNRFTDQYNLGLPIGIWFEKYYFIIMFNHIFRW